MRMSGAEEHWELGLKIRPYREIFSFRRGSSCAVRGSGCRECRAVGNSSLGDDGVAIKHLKFETIKLHFRADIGRKGEGRDDFGEADRGGTWLVHRDLQHNGTSQ